MAFGLHGEMRPHGPIALGYGILEHALRCCNMVRSVGIHSM